MKSEFKLETEMSIIGLLKFFDSLNVRIRKFFYVLDGSLMRHKRMLSLSFLALLE